MVAEDMGGWTLPLWNSLILVLSLRLHQACMEYLGGAVNQPALHIWLTCFDAELVSWTNAFPPSLVIAVSELFT
jgi:hypothetical protein